MTDDLKKLDRRNMTFAQAEGAEPLPEPLKLKEVSPELRALLVRVFYDSMEGGKKAVAYRGLVITGLWGVILRDLHVNVAFRMADEFNDSFDVQWGVVKKLLTEGTYVTLFDFIQFVLRHSEKPYNLAVKIAGALRQARAAYILVDGHTIYPKASEEEGAAIKQAFADLAKYELNGARAHLRAAGEQLNGGNYADSIRESIHAVEAVARTLSPDAAKTLGPALAALEKKTALHPALKNGFSAIYGYTNDEQGIRHALVDEPVAAADIADAVFMIGACASFISYLVAKATEAGIDMRKDSAAAKPHA